MAAPPRVRALGGAGADKKEDPRKPAENLILAATMEVPSGTSVGSAVRAIGRELKVAPAELLIKDLDYSLLQWRGDDDDATIEGTRHVWVAARPRGG